MDSDRVQILHVTDGNGGVVGITHYLIFDFLVTLDTLFHQYLMYGRKGQGIFHSFGHFLRVGGESAAGTAKSKGRTQNNRVADFFRCGKTFFKTFRNFGRNHRLSQFFAQFFKLFAVLRPSDAGRIGAQELDLAFVKNTFIVKLQ